jgi:hypothetical protein
MVVHRIRKDTSLTSGVEDQPGQHSETLNSENKTKQKCFTWTSSPITTISLKLNTVGVKQRVQLYRDSEISGPVITI